MDIGEVVAALLLRDFFQARQARQRVRDLATIECESAYRLVEDIVIDEYGRAANDVMARLDALDVWLDGLDADTIVDEATSSERFASARDPFKVWATSAKPRLDRALADMNHIRSVAPELRQPAETFALVSEIMNAVEVYESAVHAYLARDFDVGGQQIRQAHAAWRQMQARHGLAKYD